MTVKRFYETFHPEHYDLRINVNRKQKKLMVLQRLPVK